MSDSLPTLDDVAAMVSSALERHRGMVAMFDADDCLQWANTGYRKALGLTGNELGMSWAELMRRSYKHRVGPKIETSDFDAWLVSACSRRGGQTYRQYESGLCDGTWILVTQTIDERGWMLELCVDVSDFGAEQRELRIARDQALRASQVDALTGIGNRAFVLQNLNRALAGGDDWLPCVALLDLDHFKRVNDWLGHAAGDEVLRHFAQNLQAGLRRVDICGRIGGEEFLLVLGSVDLGQAEEIVNRLLTRLRIAHVLPERPDFSCTASVGLTRARFGERAEEVMARADMALYLAKQRGRDRCVCVE